MVLSLQVENAVGDFAYSSGFLSHGGVVIDLDGTAVHEDNGRITIPRPVELGLKALYDRGRPVVLNSLRFPLSVIRTFGKEWLAISNSPIPVVSMNGSQVGYIKRDEHDGVCFEEITAFPLTSNEIDACLAGVDALLDDNIRDLLLFYYPRDWRMGEIIWTPIAESVDKVKEKYKSASAVTAVEIGKLQEQLHSEEICMIFLLIERKADDLMAYQHSKPSSFFTTKGVDKLTGARAAADYIGFQMRASLGAGDTPMDVFLNGVGLAVHVGPMNIDFRGLMNTIRVADSFELGDVLFRLAGIQELQNAIGISEKKFSKGN
ncbi:MAG TPA: HAD hydrolase family protein [Pyrinomonadaceae bacterium]|nr:HAD hydrolase family protein [Pyrinomonadaceae bacterium]